ncbi:GntR family transcriptional regulator [Ligilactobacillus sp. LYQ135]
MKFTFNQEDPLYIQIAKQLEEMILTKELTEGEQVPSTTQLSQALKVNPATVLKGMNLLVDNQLIEKKRGMGMFVRKGAYQKIVNKRQDDFYQNFIEKMVSEAQQLNISKQKLFEMIERGYSNDNTNS